MRYIICIYISTQVIWQLFVLFVPAIRWTIIGENIFFLFAVFWLLFALWDVFYGSSFWGISIFVITLWMYKTRFCIERDNPFVIADVICFPLSVKLTMYREEIQPFMMPAKPVCWAKHNSNRIYRTFATFDLLFEPAACTSFVFSYAWALVL